MHAWGSEFKPQYPCKKDAVVYIYKYNPQEADTDGPLGFAGQLLKPYQKAYQWETLPSKQMNRIYWELSLSSGLHTHTHACTCIPFPHYPEGESSQINLKGWNQEAVLSRELVFYSPCELQNDGYTEWSWSKLPLNTGMYGLLLFILYGVY